MFGWTTKIVFDRNFRFFAFRNFVFFYQNFVFLLKFRFLGFWITFNFWLKFCYIRFNFWSLWFFFRKHFLLQKFPFSIEIFVFFNQVLIWIKMLIFEQNFYIRWKLEFLMKIGIFDLNFEFLIKIWSFDQKCDFLNLDFSSKFVFLSYFEKNLRSKFGFQAKLKVKFSKKLRRWILCKFR